MTEARPRRTRSCTHDAVSWHARRARLEMPAPQDEKRNAPRDVWPLVLGRAGAPSVSMGHGDWTTTRATTSMLLLSMVPNIRSFHQGSSIDALVFRHSNRCLNAIWGDHRIDSADVTA